MTGATSNRPDPPVRRCVLLFARPAREEAKRKRIPDAAPLFERTERAVREALRGLPGVDLLVCRPASLSGLASGRDAAELVQRGDTFAERIGNAFTDAFVRGYGRVVAVGSDSPGLSAGHLRAAFGGLESSPAVFGPAADGGVYLIGLSSAGGLRFEGVPWRTRDARRGLIAAYPGAVLLPGLLRDVDGGRDLRTLRDRIRACPEAAGEFDDATVALLFDLFATVAPRGAGPFGPASGTGHPRTVSLRGPPGPGAARPLAGPASPSA